MTTVPQVMILMQQPVSCQYPSYKWKAVKGLGISQIVLGSLLIICNIVSLVLGYDAGASGMWSGPIIIVAGVFAIASAKKRKRGFIVTSLVLSTVAAAVAGGAALVAYINHYYFHFYEYNRWIFLTVMCLCASATLPISIIVAALACKVICTTQAVPYQQQVNTFSGPSNSKTPTSGRQYANQVWTLAGSTSLDAKSLTQIQQPAYASLSAAVAGLGQFITGVLLLLFRMAAMYTGAGQAYNGVGYPAAVMFMISGIFGWLSSARKTKCSIVTAMVLAIVSSAFVIPVIILAAIGISEDAPCYNDMSFQCTVVKVTDKVAMNAVIIILALLQLWTSVWTSALSCTLCCFSQNENNENTNHITEPTEKDKTSQVQPESPRNLHNAFIYQNGRLAPVQMVMASSQILSKGESTCLAGQAVALVPQTQQPSQAVALVPHAQQPRQTIALAPQAQQPYQAK